MVIEAPLSFGQLYSWREIDAYPEDCKHEANLPATWDLRGSTLAQAQAALSRLVRRHDSLRTTYSLRDGVPVQLVQADVPAPVEVVERVVTGPADADASTESLLGMPFPMTGELCWRAVLVTSGGAPMFVSLSFSHLILDVWSVLELERQFRAELASASAESGGPVGAESGGPFGPMPRELAAQQRQESAAGRRAASERYWRGVLPEQVDDRLPAPGDGVRQHRIQATLHSHRLGVLAAQVAREQGVTAPAVLMGLMAAGLSEHLGTERVVMSLMSSNRFAAEHRHVVTTMNQLIPVVVTVDHGASLAEHVTRLHWAAAKAYRYSSYDLDRVLAIAAETGVGEGFTSLFRCWFNYLQLDAEPPEAGRDTPAELIWTPVARQHGQPFDVRVTLRGGRTSVALRTDPHIVPANALTGMLRMLSLGVERAAADPSSALRDLWNCRGADVPASLFPADAPALAIAAG